MSPTAPRCSLSIAAVTTTPDSVASTLADQMKRLGIDAHGQVWAIKLNLTYPEYLPGVVNSPIFVEGLCQWATASGLKLIFVEGDGGNGTYSAQDAFDGNSVTAVAKRYGMRTRSLSERPWHWRETKVGVKTVRLPYSPFFAARPYDKFVTAPLFKNHIFTTVTLGMKNLWGCIPNAYRMYYHHFLDHGIVALHKELSPDLAIYDGLVGLRGPGPMDGRPVSMNSVMVATDAVEGDVAATTCIMGLDIKHVRHLKLAIAEGLALDDIPASRWDRDPAPFKRTDFVMERTLLNYATIALGQFPSLQRAVYHSAASKAIYSVVDRLRPGSAQRRLVDAKRRHVYHDIPFTDPGRDSSTGRD